jgi:hypothetical protein
MSILYNTLITYSLTVEKQAANFLCVCRIRQTIRKNMRKFNMTKQRIFYPDIMVVIRKGGKF